MSAIFISHSSQDDEAARVITDWLRSQGHRSVFLDFDPELGIPAGRDWEQELYRMIRVCRAVVVICSRSSMASRWCFMEITHARALGKHLFPVRIDDCEIDGVLTDRQVIDLRVEQLAAFARLERGLEEAGIDPADAFDWDGSRSPYPGLLAFQEEDAAIFFGRDREIGEGLDLLGRVCRLGEPAFVMILGASGAGKSSLVRAGILPRLRRDADHWIVVPPFRARSDAIRELAAALGRTYAQLGHPRHRTEIEGEIRDAIRGGDESRSTGAEGNVLVGLADDIRLTSGRDDARVLLTVDQFEELLGHPDRHPSTILLGLLRGAAEYDHTPLVVLGTMRSDHLGAFQQHPALVGVETRSLSLGPLTVASIAQVISRPAALAGIDLEEGLVEQMTADAETDDALPLLAFALRRLYEQYASDGLLSLPEYVDGLGGLQGAIAAVADELVESEQLSEERASDLRRAFLAMVRLRDDDVYVRQPAPLDAMPAGSRDLLDRFVDARLLVASGDEQQRTIEVAHEALFRSWERLRRWLDESRQALVLHRDLDQAAFRWDESGRSPDDLWRGGRLQLARELLDAGEIPVDEASVEFVGEGERSERAIVEQAATRRRRLRFAAAAVLLAFALGATAFAVVTSRERDRALAAETLAEAGEAEARARALAANAEAARPTDPGLAALLALEADRLTTTPETTSAMHAIVASTWERTLPGSDGADAAAISGDGTRAVVAGADGVVVWDLRSDAGATALTDDRVSSVAISDDGSRVLTNGGYTVNELAGPTTFPGEVTIWNLDDRQADPVVLTQGPQSIASLSPDGDLVLTVGNGVQVWDADGGSEPRTITTDFVDQAAFDRDGARVASAGFDGLAVWNVDGGPPVEVTSEPLVVESVAFSNDGARLVTTSGWQGFDENGRVVAEAGEVEVWDIESGERSLLTTGRIASARFGPDDARIITAGADGATVWNTGTRTAESTLTPDVVTVADLTADGSRAFTLGEDGGAVIWNFELGGPLQVVTEVAASGAEFAPDGTDVLTVDAVDGVQVWDLATGSSNAVHAGAASSAEFDPVGERVLTATDFIDSGTPAAQPGVAIWDVRAGPGPEIVTPRTAFTASYSDDGRRIVSTGDYSVADSEGVVVWALGTGDAVQTVTTDRVVDAEFDPGGTRVVTAGESGAAVWDLDGVAPPLELASGRANRAEFDPAGELVLTVGESGVVLWPLDGGAAPVTLTTAEQGSASFDPQGGRVVTAGEDGVVLWDIGGRPLADIATGVARSAEFDAAGNRIVSAGDDGVRIWRAWTAEELRSELEARLADLALTPSQCIASRIGSCPTT